MSVQSLESLLQKQPRDYDFIKTKEVAHKYVFARLIELESLLDYLVNQNKIKRANLAGPIACLGVGSGADLWALRRQSWGSIIGVDNNNQTYSGNRSNYYAGDGLENPSDNAPVHTFTVFHHGDALDFLTYQPYNHFSLVTAFYMHSQCFTEGGGHTKLLEEVGKVLKPEGQFLITSDRCQSWGKFAVPWGTKSQDSYPHVLRLPSSKKLMKLIGPTVLKQCWDYLEPGTNEETIDNQRDRHIWIFTKGK